MGTIKINNESSASATRRLKSAESFRTAADCIGEITPGKSLFAITRGQFSMIDAILHCLDQCGRSKLSLWTWTIAEYEVQCFERLMVDGRLLSASMIIDKGAQRKNAEIIKSWIVKFGPKSVRFALNHAKIATIESEKFRILLRGSMNLNFNPRFEQFDLTEGGEDFDLVRKIENELPYIENPTQRELYAATKVGQAFSKEQLSLFDGIKTWKK